jgi:hypothetical protein
MSGRPNRESTDASSAARKRALRRLACEEQDTYQLLYEEVRPNATSRTTARGQAWTRLRWLFPDRYLELFADERGVVPSQVPARVRSRAWSRATAALADLRKDQYRSLYDQKVSDGVGVGRAYESAMVEVRNQNPEVFMRLLADQIALWSAENVETMKWENADG